MNEPQRVDDFLLNSAPDEQDLRDYTYQPALVQLRGRIEPPQERIVLDQGREGACTGLGLAAVINRLLAARHEQRTVSPRMLDEMAKKFDRWEGEDYSGSSCRGAIRGWHNMGVCSAELAPYKAGDDDWHLTIEQAKDARTTTVGAYYRIAKVLSHYHAALNEVGVLYASAGVHEGWSLSKTRDGEIPTDDISPLGVHAFAIVGYDANGFYLQNPGDQRGAGTASHSGGTKTGSRTFVMRGFLRLALSTPQVSHLGPSAGEDAGREQGLLSRKPRRAEVAGHFVHIDDGRFDDEGRYWSNLTTVRRTAELVAKSGEYEHLLLYAHGGLNSVAASARRIAAMKEIFKRNRIYPFHFMYDTGLLRRSRMS